MSQGDHAKVDSRVPRRLETEPQPLTRSIGSALVLALLYAVVARLCLAMDAVSGFATLVWPPTGIALASVLFRGRAMLPGVFLGAFAANLWVGAPPVVALGIAAGNTAEAWGAAVALRHLGIRLALDRLSDVAALVVFGALLSTLVSATVGVVSLLLGHVIGLEHALPTWRAWWLGDALGDLVVAPFLLAWFAVRWQTPTPARLVEAGALGLAAFVMPVGIFFSGAIGAGELRHHVYFLFPILIWAALRFGVRGASFTGLAVSALAIVGTARGEGPFADGATLAERLVVLQTFSAVVAVTMLLLAAAVAERTRAVRVRDRFLAMVSHDLRNPLTVIQLRATQLAKLAASNEAMRSVGLAADRIIVAVDRMDHLIRDLRDVAAIEAGKLSMEVREEDLRSVVEEAIDPLRPLAEERRLLLAAQVPLQPLLVTCDRRRVLQCLSNILGNALKFTGPLGTVTVDVERRDDFAVVRVTDTGIGMEPADAVRAFEPFWQGTEGDARGMGLGLFITRQIVEAQHGQICIHSHVGRGTWVEFTLPLCERDSRQAAASVESERRSFRPSGQRLESRD